MTKAFHFLKTNHFIQIRIRRAILTTNGRAVSRARPSAILIIIFNQLAKYYRENLAVIDCKACKTLTKMAKGQ